LHEARKTGGKRKKGVNQKTTEEKKHTEHQRPVGGVTKGIKRSPHHTGKSREEKQTRAYDSANCRGNKDNWEGEKRNPDTGEDQRA